MKKLELILAIRKLRDEINALPPASEVETRAVEEQDAHSARMAELQAEAEKLVTALEAHSNKPNRAQRRAERKSK